MIEKYLKLIDHTLLRQDATLMDVQRCCLEAKQWGFCSVITQPWYVPQVRRLLDGTGVKCGTVVGFPFGAEYTPVKVFQAERALEAGAQELDMVMNISAFKNGDYEACRKDIEAVAKVGLPLKVIIETSLLSREEIIKACKICADGGAAFAKTSTGYFGGGATVENVRLMKEACGGRIKVKAAGGIKSAEDLVAMVEAGAERIGTSNAVNIAKGLEANGY